MATILTKKSDTSSSVPLAADLTNAAGGAELAVNTADKRLYSKTSGGSVVELGTNPSLMVLPSATSQPSGSANGVPYLNGSKVLTTGSALTFDGVTLQVSGSVGGKVTSKGTSGQTILEAVTTSNIATLESRPDISYSRVTSSAYLLDIATLSNQPILFTVNNAEQMRLTSTGLGIGTSSPGERLTIVGAGVTYASLKGETTTLYQVAGDASCGFFNNAAVPLTFGTNNTERMRIDSAGNVGIGTSSPATKLHVKGGDGNQIRYEGASNIYALGVTGGGLGYVGSLTNTNFSIITNINTVATFDTSGNLGLGVTPSAWDTSVMRALQVGSGATFAGDTPGAAFRARILANAYYGSGGAYRYIGNGPALLHTVNANSSTFEWNIAGTGTAGNAISFTQAMTLDARGNWFLGGTSTPFASSGRTVATINGSSQALLGLTVGGTDKAYLYTDGTNTTLSNSPAGALIFATNAGTERARIDSSGNLLVGTTSAYSARFSLLGATNTSAAYIQVGTDSYYGIGFRNSAGTGVGGIVVNTSAVAYNTTSDYRLKNVIGAVTDAGKRIDALEPIEYEWKTDGSRTRGFLAHKFQEVYAGSVNGTKDAVDVEGKPVYQSMQASSSEVIADLVAEIQSMRQRLAALEAA